MNPTANSDHLELPITSNAEPAINRPPEEPLGQITEEGDTITPIATPANVGIGVEEGGAWKVVTRKTKDKGQGIQSGVQLYFGSGLPGGGRGPNPYLS